MKPNVLWICTDQQRYDTLRCNGNDRIDTPNLDALAARGTRFENAYCQSPVCSPSRGSFLTGRYPRTCRLRQNGQRIPAEETLVTKLFAQAGYTAGLVGKLHIAPCHTSVCRSSEPRIDDGYSVFHWSHHPDYYGRESNWPLNEYNIWLASQGQQYTRTPYNGSEYVTTGPDQEYCHSHWCAEKSIEFIRAHAAYPSNPWLLSVNLYDPHHDFDPCRELLEKYRKRLGEKDLPNYQPGELDNKPQVQQQDHEGAYGVPGWYEYDKMTDQDHLLVKAAYYAMVEQLDREVGRILAALEESGQADNTIVVFHSDHGEMLGDHGIYLKGGYFYEPMIKVPLLFSWPGRIASGVTRTALTELVDIAPTLLDLCGLPAWPGMQGRSLRALLSENNCQDYHRSSVYCEYGNAMRHNGNPGTFASMVATEQYKLCYYHDENCGELYDLQEDPQERRNLYEESAYAQIRTEMLQTLLNRIAFTADPLPVREAAY